MEKRTNNLEDRQKNVFGLNHEEKKGGRTQKSEKDLIKKWRLTFCIQAHSHKPPQMLEENKALLNLTEI